MIATALAADDLDAALDAGLLASEGCPRCTEACTRSLLEARDARRFALASRERFRARQARLAQRQQQRLQKRMQARGVPAGGAVASFSLPAAAAAALARAKERAGGRGNA